MAGSPVGQLRPANIVHLSEKWADMALGSLHGGFTPNPCYARAFVGLLPSNPGQTESR